MGGAGSRPSQWEQRDDENVNQPLKDRAPADREGVQMHRAQETQEDWRTPLIQGG